MWKLLRHVMFFFGISNALQSIFHDRDEFGYDCLHYFSADYCLRPHNDNNFTLIETLNISDRYFTFNELYHLNISSQKIFLWSSSIHLAEQYQFYLDQSLSSNLSNEIFVNCTDPWFGSRCQYSLKFDEDEIRWQKSFSDTRFPQTCYIHLECDRGGQSICLDWREICNGRIDCLNDGVDEVGCWNLEINECAENEYRCHNGQCIPKIFLQIEMEQAQCLDRSDVIVKHHILGLDDRLVRFEFQEFVCRPDEGQFSCGDGNDCVDDFHPCPNNRHLALIRSMSAQKNLSYPCWIVMVCLSKILDPTEKISCDHVMEDFRTCHFPLQFPVIPVLFGHVRFFYHPKLTDNLSRTFALKPDYICYDEQLCDFLPPTFRYENFTCRYANQTGLQSYAEFLNWTSMIDSIKPYFLACSTERQLNLTFHSSSLYKCQNSSKYISKYRIVDGKSDCFLNDDEQAFELSCLLNQTFRFQCPNEQQCRSPISLRNRCSSFTPIDHKEILFYQICDRIVDLPLISINGQHHSDETDCEDWQCNNIYTRCDGFPNCLNGEDERNCTQTITLSHFLFCLSLQNSTLMCLPADQVDGGTVDCRGMSFDQDQYFETNEITLKTYKFRYWNHTECFDEENICENEKDCLRYRHSQFCVDHSKFNNDSDLNHLLNAQNIRCRIVNTNYLSFSLDTALVYPSLPTIPIDALQDNEADEEIGELLIENGTRLNVCNHGLYVHHRLEIGHYDGLCFCSPKYYGNRCQYQNQRVSLTLVLATVQQPILYAIIVTLMEDDNDRQEIHSYDQFTYESKAYCGQPIDIDLLYAYRGKNTSKNYRIRVDVFDKTSLTYFISWYLKVPFPWLPVNRVSAFLTLPISRTLNPIRCHLRCDHGRCEKYYNEERFFCLCSSGWSGAQCQIPIDCRMCALNSICLGSIRNRSICVCPQNSFGSSCRLKLICPTDYCQNQGRCVVINERMVNNESYVCFCPEQFSGPRCEYISHRIEISLEKMEIPPYLLVYIYDKITFEQSIPTFVILKKMLMFQSDAIFYTAQNFQMILVKVDYHYYLAALQKFQLSNITTSISPAQRYAGIDELFDTKLLSQPRIRRLKNYNLLCRDDVRLQCFVDEYYMCLCTEEHQSNCFLFDHRLSFVCEENVFCENGGTCLQDRSMCFYSLLCACRDCFFGDRCQFYAKGIGLTLDDLLRYEIRPNSTFHDQSLGVKLSAASMLILFFIGLSNSFGSYLVFYHRNCRRVGSGMYLRASSIISTLVVGMLIIKFSFVTYTYMNLSITRPILRMGCILLEPMLRLFVHMSNWLHTCVATERAVAVFQGIHFNRRKSRCIAQWLLYLLPLLILSSMGTELAHRDLFDDEEERRVWCVVRYSPSTELYTTIVQYFHFVAPFSLNLFSALFIIVSITRQKTSIRTQATYQQQLLKQIDEHKRLVVSPIVTVVLLFPRFLVSLLSKCVKTSRTPWLYLYGYFVSFIPSSFIFIIFVLPSTFYRRQFRESITSYRQRLIKMMRS